MKQNTFIIPIIQPDHIGQMLESLYKYTEPNFNVIVIDQTNSMEAVNKYKHLSRLWIHVYRNLGFAKAMNTGIRLADTKYVTLANDDLIFMDKRWWPGIIDTFRSDPKILGVNPMSPKEATWGYGRTNDNYRDWKAPTGFTTIDDLKEGMYPVKDGRAFPQENWTEDDYTWLLKEHPTWKENSMCDAIAMWCTTFRTSDLIGQYARLGLLDERFFPGGGEDYRMNANAYSCALPIDREDCDEDYHFRMVGSARSWVWHKWSSSRNLTKLMTDNYYKSRPRWNANEELWTPSFDVWGHYRTKDGEKKPIRQVKPPIIEML